MKIQLYDYHELEDRASKNLSVWKAWHIILFVCAAAFGIMNYTFLQSTMQLVDDNCLLYPKILEFHWVELPEVVAARDIENKENASEARNKTEENAQILNKIEEINETDLGRNKTKETAEITNDRESPKTVDKREALDSNETEDAETGYITQHNVTTIEEKNITIITVNTTHRLMLYTERSIFGKYSDCQFAEFMPLLSTIFAIVWVTFFLMCPPGGRVRTRTGLQQPWRILTPALVFALVLVAVTGYSFSITNGGLQAFCAAFHNHTHATTCSPVNPFLERGWNATWGMGGRAAATRAAAAGVWVSWACAAALLLARCLAAPDFNVRRTDVSLVDPQKKVSAHLGKSPRRSQRSANRSPSKRDNASVKSEPTMSTEVVASVEHGPDSDPTSLATTPVKLRGEQ